jgi:hypothetical protein
MKRTLLVMALWFTPACAGRQAPPPPAHTGWTLRYTQRVGEGSAPPRDVRPDVAMGVLDGRARVALSDRGIEGRIDHATQRADLCRMGSCSPGRYADVLARLAAVDELPEAHGLVEDPPSSDSISDPMEIANVPTTGARFVGTVHTASGPLRVQIEARWIDSPGEASVEVVKDFFLTPVERIGARALAARIRETAGLPLHWEVRMQQAHPDGSTAEGAVVFHAAELGNPPASLGVP